MSNLPEKSLIEVNSFQDIPDFQNEDEEADFWANHGLGNDILDTMENIDNSIFFEDIILLHNNPILI